MNQGAEFSKDRRYRYALWRIWNEDKPLVMFIGLNPSVAPEKKDDPTIRRVTRFAHDWGYGGFYMMNLFAYVTPYPAVLSAVEDPIGENDLWVEKISLKCEMIVFAWGAFGEPKRRRIIRDRAEALKNRFSTAYCIKKTKTGHPSHPLYLLRNLKPIPYFETPKPWPTNFLPNPSPSTGTPQKKPALLVEQLAGDIRTGAGGWRIRNVLQNRLKIFRRKRKNYSKGT